MLSEAATINSGHIDPTDYNSSLSLNEMRYNNNTVYTNIRKFVVVRTTREVCYALPIFTYSRRATLKRGIKPSEHGIAYSWGEKPQLIQGEQGITKAPIAVVMDESVPQLHVASRIFYGIHHPIQYNVKVKAIGYVPEKDVPILIINWMKEYGDDDDDEVDSGDEEEEAEGEEEEEEQKVESSAQISKEDVEEGEVAKYEDRHAKGKERATEWETPKADRVEDELLKVGDIWGYRVGEWVKVKIFGIENGPYTVASVDRQATGERLYQLNDTDSTLVDGGKWFPEHRLIVADREEVPIAPKRVNQEGDDIGESHDAAGEEGEYDEDDDVEEGQGWEASDHEDDGIAQQEDKHPKRAIKRSLEEDPELAKEPGSDTETDKAAEDLKGHQANPGTQRSDTTARTEGLAPEIEA